MPAISLPGSGRPTTVRLALALLAALLLLTGAGAVRAADAHACAAVALPGPLTDFYNVAPSCFEGGDGNLEQDVVDPAFFDWETISGETIFSDPTGDPGNEGQFVTGSKEQDPTSWEIGATEPSASKADITAAASKIADVGGDKFLYLAFQTRGDSGSVNGSIELNKTPALWDNGTSMIPTRSQGDLLITYDGNQQTNTQRIGLCIWKGDRAGQGSLAPGSSDFGWHDFDDTQTGNFGDLITGSNKECAEVELASAVAGVNDTETLSNAGNTILAAPFLESLDPDTFGELSINLSSLFGENQDPCFDFGGLWLHTREGNSVAAAMEDYLKPKAIEAGGNCGATLDKKVAVGNVDGPTGSYHEGTDADPSYADEGDTLWYSIAITNTGSVTFEPTVEELGCIDLVRTGANAGDATFDGGDAWTYRCKHVLVEGDPDPYVNTACVTGKIGSFAIDETVDGTCDSTSTHRNPKVVAIDIDKQTTTPIAYNGDTLKYTYRVTNPGGEPLSEVTVTDDKCTSVVLATKNGDTTEDTLDPGDTWDYTCEQPAPTTDIGAPALVNTATATGTDRDQDKVTDTDTAQVEFRHPKIDIKKTGPATAVAGELITYTLVVTNPGDTRFDDGPNGENGAVVVTDPLCQAPPKLLNKDGDNTAPTSSLDPGDAWTYTCQVQTQVGQTAPVVNTAFVKGTDTPGNKVVESSSAATTVLSPPATGVSPGDTTGGVTPRRGTARLSGTVGCAASRYASAIVSGSQIRRVTFTVNGKKVKTLTKPNAGKTYRLRYRTTSLEVGAYKVRAKVEFSTASGTKAKTLNLQFSRCKPRVVKPTFTG